MTIFSQPQGAAPGQVKACVGTPVVVNLTTAVSGNSQNSYLVPTDFVIVATADSSNKGVTIPDPNKYGGTPGDSFLVINGQSGQTINVFPPTGGNIDAAGSNTAITVAVGTTATVYLQSFTATTSVWISDAGS